MKFNQKKEEFKLECDFILDPLALVTNHEAEILVTPSLLINNYPTTVSVIKAASVEIEITNESNIKSTLEFNDLQFIKEDLLLKFRVPAKLKHIQIKLNAKLKQLTSEKFMTLTASKAFQIQNTKEANHRYIIFNIELIKIKDEYYINLVGKNGEDVPNVEFEISIYHQYFKKPFKQLLRTDEHGLIALGVLENIIKVEAVVLEKLTTPRIERNWDIDVLERGRRKFCTKIYCIEGKDIFLPFDAGQPLELNDLELLHFSLLNSDLLEKIEDCIEISEDLGVIKISKLSDGKYTLIDKKSQEIINIRVVKGYHLTDETLIYYPRKNRIYENAYVAKKIACIDDINIDKDQIQIDLKGYDNSTRVHVIGVPYLADEADYANLNKKIKNALLYMKPIKNEQKPRVEVRLADVNIDPITAYVQSRRVKPKIMGTILERPTFLLNSQSGSNSSQNRPNLCVDSSLRSSDNFGLGLKQKHKKISSDSSKLIGRTYINHWESNVNSNARLYSVTFQETEIISNLFLKAYLSFPSKIISSLVPNEQGTVIINESLLNTKNYRALHVICINKYSYEIRVVNLNNKEIEKNDLKLKSLYDIDKTYKQDKKEEVVLKDENVTIQDLTNAEIQIIDSIDKLFKCQREIKKTISNDNENLPEGYNTWSWLPRWHQLPLEKKVSFYLFQVNFEKLFDQFVI